MTSLREFDVILLSGLVCVFVLHDRQFEPGPVAGSGIVAEALVMRFGMELHAMNPRDGLWTKRLFTDMS